MTHNEKLINQAMRKIAQEDWMFDFGEGSDDVTQCEALGLTGEELEKEVAARCGALVYATMRVNKGNYEFDIDPEANWLND